jgi:putative oxidoreductase
MKQHVYVRVAWFLLRVVSGLVFFQAGAMKLFGWYGGLPPGVTVKLASQVGFGGVLEVVGGVAVMAGLATRPVAFLLSGEMAVAYWQFHAPRGTWPIQNHGESAVLFCFLFAYGGGDWSLDGLLERRRRAPYPLI